MPDIYKVNDLLDLLVCFPNLPILVQLDEKTFVPLNIEDFYYDQHAEKIIFKWANY